MFVAKLGTAITLETSVIAHPSPSPSRVKLLLSSQICEERVIQGASMGSCTRTLSSISYVLAYYEQT